MLKKHPVISKEAQVLLKLLRLALGTEPRHYFGEPVEPFPTNINWKEVIRLSYEHKVSALAVDGLKSSGYDIYNGLNNQQTQKLKSIIEHWFNDVAKSEQSYSYYINVLTTLCQLLKSNDLTPIILKGYGLSLNYPIPSHRGAGDIDIFLIDKDGIPAYEKGDKLLRDVLRLQFVDEDKVAEHHSEAFFKGITIENHKELIGASRNGANEQNLKKILKKLITEGIESKNGIYYPSATFNCIYQLLHIYSHAYCGILNFRQLCDYLTFLKIHSNEIDWAKASSLLRQYGFHSFETGLNTIMVKTFGLNAELLEDGFVPDFEFADKMLKDALTYRKKTDTESTLSYNFKNRWHLNYYFQTNWFKQTVMSMAVEVTHNKYLSWMRNSLFLQPIKRLFTN